MNSLWIQDALAELSGISAPLPSSDRRREPRYVPGETIVYLGWWEGAKFRAELGLLQNFSAGGAAVEIAAEPDAAEPVWLCVAGPGRVTWMPARQVGREGRAIRLQFAEPMPYELFELLV